jgi:hypothetical protein
VLSLCLLSACAQPAGRNRAIPPPIRVPHSDPAYNAQVRLLQEARRAFVQERYPAAALFFKRFIDDAQDSVHLAEARWWLGRAYEQLGNPRAAMAQYRLVVGSASQQVDGVIYEGYALRRLDELRRLRADGHREHATQLAFRVTSDQLPSLTDLVPWLQELAQVGVTVVAIAPAQATKPGYQGFNVETIRSVAAEAHRLGLFLWVALNLHDGQGMDIRPEWMARTMPGARYGDSSVPKVDIAHPAYQSYVEEIVRTLGRAGCDGVLLAARSTAGFAEEFSDDSLRLFAASFRLSGNPEEMFGVTASSDAKTGEQPAIYWRWVGWKARNYAQFAGRLSKVLREGNPAATLSFEVHQSALTTPLQGIEQFGEDVAELTPHSGGSVVVRHEGMEAEAALEKLGRQLGRPDRVWIGVSLKAAARPFVIEDFKPLIGNLEEVSRWNMVIDTESVQTIP